MKIKMLEPRVVMGIPRAVKDVVDVPVEIAREFVAKKWAISEESVKAEELSKAQKRGLSERLTVVEEKIANLFEGMDAFDERINDMEEKNGTFEVEPELVAEPKVENREADLDKKTAKRDDKGAKK